jgi:ATP-binding cassette subfamily B protein
VRGAETDPLPMAPRILKRLNVGPIRSVRGRIRITKRLIGLSGWRFAWVAFLAVATGIVESAALLLLVRIATAVAAGDQEVTLDVGPLSGVVATIPELLLSALVLTALRAGLQVLNGMAIARLGADALRNLRKLVMHHYFDASWSVQSDERQSELVEIVGGQSVAVATIVVAIITGVAQTLRVLVMVIAAVIIEPLGALTIVVAAILMASFIRPLTRAMKAHAKVKVAMSLALSRSLFETSGTMSEVRVFGVTEPVRETVDERIDDVSGAWRKAEIFHRLLPAVYQMLAMFALVATLAVMYQLESQATSMGAVIIIMVRALSGTQGMQGTFNKLYEMAPILDLVADRLRKYRRESEVRGDRTVGVIADLAFDDVSFEYVREVKALDAVSFEVRQGEAIGIVGASGAGKSTMVQILLGLRQPTSGHYRVNGLDAYGYDGDSWYSDLGLVPQQPRMIEASVRENIRFFRPHLTDEDIEAAARMANLHDEILGWADGYGTHVSEQGASLSGGQRQRVALARAFAGHPSLLVLDEPTSALDMQSEALIAEALLLAKSKMTLFIVAHRLSTLNVCDRIMVLNHGRLEHFAPAGELEDLNSFFREAVELSRQ